jgi:cytochrome c553
MNSIYDTLSEKEIAELNDFFDSLEKEQEALKEVEANYHDSIENKDWKKVV